MLNKLFDGPIVTLEDMMIARENRQFKQRDLFEKFSNSVVLSVTMNIPGDVKVSGTLETVFNLFIMRLKKTIQDIPMLFDNSQRLKTGLEYYAVVHCDAIELKRRMIALEQETADGRLMDIDVLTNGHNGISPMSRQELGYPARLCYVCGDDAKVCGRSRKHTIEQMRLAIAQLLQSL